MKLLSTLTVVAAITALLLTGCSRRGTKGRESDSTSSGRVRVLDDSNFDAEVQRGVVLVDFWATWCGPCKMQAPIVEQVAAQIEPKAKVGKVDVDAAPKIAQRFGVQAIPTLVVFKNGKAERRFVGVTKAEALLSAVNGVLDSQQ